MPGIDGVYIHEGALFDTLLKEQERMTAAIFKMLGSNAAAQNVRP